MNQPGLPAPERWLLRWALRGEGSEFLLGDLLERYQDDLDRDLPAGSARRRLRREALGAVWAWWRPRAVRARLDGREQGLGDGFSQPRRTASGRWSVGGWRQDLSMAWRGVLRRPRFAWGVALTLGVGIGATTTIYSVVDGVLLRPLPYAEPGRIVAVGATFPGREWEEGRADLQHLAGISLANLEDFRQRTRTIEPLAAIERTSLLLPDLGEGPEIVPAAEVESAFFSVLGVRPALGRTFASDEQGMAAAGVVMLSWAAWQSRFGADPSVVGRPLERFGGTLTVVGVLPADFQPPETFFGTTPEFWLPLRSDHPRYAERGRRSLAVVGRLRPGATLDAAREEGRTVAAALARTYPEGNVYPDGTHLGIGVNALLDETVGTSARTLRMFLVAAALLLTLSALNAATLLLARALERVRELDIRSALGSGRWRLMRLLLGEAGLLALLGGAVGVGCAYAGVAVFSRYAPDSIPRLQDVAVDGRILAVALLLAVGAGLAAGLLPALRLSSPERDRLGNLRARGRHHGAARMRSVLVGGQMAVAMVLVSSAALLFTSFLRLRANDPGFEAEHLVTLDVPLKRPGAPDGPPWQDWDRLLAELASVPGVVAVAGTSDAPFRSPSWAPRLLLPGDAEDVRREGIAGYAVTPGYFSTLHTDVIQGRDFRDSDGPDGEPVAVVNAAFVRSELDGREPLGLPVRLLDGDSDRTVRIVGVVEDVIQTSTDEGPRAALYVPHRQVAWTSMEALIRTEVPPAVVASGLRDAARRFNPVLPSGAVRPMDERMAATRVAPRFHALLIGGFGSVAALLAALGLYGALAQAVGERRAELGVRMALGAEPRAVLRLVLRRGFVVAVWGLATGLLFSLATGRVLASFLYAVRPGDPWLLAGTGLVLLAAALLASWLPARRATTLDLVRVLRAD